MKCKEMSITKSKDDGFNYTAISLLSLTYLLYGMLRKVVPVSTSLLIRHMNFSKADIGLISASFGVGFGLSKLIGGFLCSIYSCKRILIIGLCTASLASLAFLLIQPNMSLHFRLVWMWHGFAQGIGWPAIANLIYANFDMIGRGTVWSFISSAGNFGSILVPLIFIPLMGQSNWKIMFFSIGLSGVAGSALLFVGLADKAKDSKEIESESSGEKGINLDQETDRHNFLYNTQFWLLIASNSITSFLMTSVSDWLGPYLLEVCELYNPFHMQQILFAYEIGGFIGTLSCGILCDKLFRGRMDVSCFCYTLLYLPAILLFPSESLNTESNTFFFSPFALTIISASLLGAAINGPKTLSGMLLRTFMPPSAFGLGGGVLGMFAQFGVFLSGTGVGWLLHHYQWTYYVTVLLYASLLSSLLLLLMVTGRPRVRRRL